MNFEQLWDLLGAIQTHIRAFDTKAQVAVGVNGVVIGLLVTEMAKVAELSSPDNFWRLLAICILIGGGLIASASAAISAIRVLHPQIELKQPRSHFFFCHIAEQYGRDFERAIEGLKHLPTEDALDEVAGQVAVNAVVCDIKAKRCKAALLLTGVALTLYAISVVPFAVLALSHANGGHIPSTPVASSLTVCMPPSPLSNIDWRLFPYTIPLATFIAALVTFLGVAVKLWVNGRSAKEQNALEARMKLADFRERWLNELRNSLSELGSEILARDDDGKPSRRFSELAIKIRLLMNRRDPHYAELDELLKAAAGSENMSSRDALVSRLTLMAQAILGIEWKTLKNDLRYSAPPDVK